MTKETSSGCTPLGVFYRRPRLMQGLSALGGLSLLSSGLVVAQTDSPVDTGVVPTTTAAPPPVQAAPAPRPAAAPDPAPIRPRPAAPETIIVPAAPAARKPIPAPVVSTPPRATVRRRVPRPAPEVSAPAPAPVVRRKPALAAPNLSVPAATTLAKPPQVIFNPSQIEETAKTPVEPGNSYIDRTDYSLGATRRYEGPSAVVLTERSSGCRTVSQNGQLASGACGVAASRRPTTNARVTRPTLPSLQLDSVTRLPMPPVASVAPVQMGSVRTSPRTMTATRRSRYAAGRPAFSPGTTSSRVSLPGQTPTGLSYYNLTSRPVGRPTIGQTSFMFPLTIPAAITSVFGWRVHPITGQYRLHAGTDIGAPQGTPVVAAASGQVVTADFVGGYGLTVILQHEPGTEESLYAHLSEVFVQPGEQVEQGNVIGRVGSTGNSTGPHLHFEWRHLTSDGWVAVDAGTHLEYSLAEFVKVLQFAQASPQRGF